MSPQLYLITPDVADPASFAQTLLAVLNSAAFSALLVRRGKLDDAAYAKLAAPLVSVGQSAGCAVLIEDDAALAKRLGADGVHVTGGPAAVKAVLAAVKPAMIVGTGPAPTRHDAMTAGELDVDYLFFGPLEGSSDAAAADLAEWWAATFEIPAVLSDPGATPAVDPRGAEFLALSSSIWSAPDPAAAASALSAALTAP
ncbi:thiamine phosphate synthase [Devosia sp.]|uniref:thiamine phosphate synthase n=1 Tax=Devosia sp. TaxID=1871048 RepID=UPI00273754FF|nr:thiamine phosphate synthase [Devosia sp.]MDP2781903.1 thiamine phosphate synthase [Devosia sp.]